MSGPSSRKVSGSSSRSRGPSPNTTKEHMNSSSSTAPSNTSVNNSSSLNTLHNKWKVWGSTTSPSTAAAKNVHIPLDYNMPAPGSSVTDTHLGPVVDDGWTTTTNIQHSISDPLPRSHLISQSRQRAVNVSQAAPAFPGIRINERPSLPPVAQWFAHSHHRDFVDGRLLSPTSPPVLPSFPNPYPIQPFSGHFELHPTHSVPDDIQAENLRRMTAEDNRTAIQFKQPVPSFHPGPPTQLTPLRSQYDLYSVPEYGNYMAQHPNPYVEYPVGFDIYGNVSGPSLYLGHLVGNLAPNNRYPLPLQSIHSGPGTEVHHHPGFPYDFGQRPTPQFYYPTPNMLISPQIPQHLPVSPLIPGSSTPYLSNFDQQSNIILPANATHSDNFPDRSAGSSRSHSNWTSHSKPRAPHVSPQAGARRRRLDPSSLPRSSLLDDFRSNRDSVWNLKNIFGHIVEFSGDQHGSRFIQQKLEEATDEEKQRVFDEIVPTKTTQLIQDVFGNYVVQKLLDFGTQAQRDLLVVIIEQNVVSFSLQIYGCRVVQKAIEYTSPEQQIRIIHELQPQILKCIKDAHGNHVIQKLIEVVSPERLMFLSTICDNLLELSTHPYGCRVLQRCLEHLPEEHTISLLQAVHHFTLDLMQDQYGNYVIQFILQQGRPQDKSRVISKIRGNLIQLAQHKFASNVCEKALICADADTRRLLISEIMTPQPDGQSAILIMVKDQYANYVLQRALTVVESDQRELFFHQVKPLLLALRKSTTAYNRPLISSKSIISAVTK
ncbi:ARM repeat-containing protein [Phlegmacium glaucopus]|nr:ARM repeat-containing protein [Phlegmacium glaucopus]